MKVAVYFATGYEEIEALAVVDVLRRGNIEVSMVGVNSKTVVSARGISINMDTTLDELNHDEIDMMVLPGGVPGVINLESSEKLMSELKSFKEKGKWLAAICAAPSILGNQGLLVGEKATCYPNYESKLIGCEHVDERVVVSGKIVTGKGAGTAIDFALKILEVLESKEVADKVRKSMIA
ncbi:MAG: DJ-1/PfpI family protein [Candidatus Cellulosilyticum pullistercoris]|uniref:DJ-1/PfpI family protein n=1 Tax=Candidatus Cellulosilyticum pullistercoris TaxID=2838521 RepID=A0A9E2KDI0_9FIRM|nr:DJ-1/PfpI family protein [Candidatus Cellulosilyticum pullistercoris]